MCAAESNFVIEHDKCPECVLVNVCSGCLYFACFFYDVMSQHTSVLLVSLEEMPLSDVICVLLCFVFIEAALFSISFVIFKY